MQWNEGEDKSDYDTPGLPSPATTPSKKHTTGNTSPGLTEADVHPFNPLDKSPAGSPSISH